MKKGKISRLKKWENEELIRIGVTGDRGPIMDFAVKFWEEKNRNRKEHSNDLSSYDMVQSSKELIFDIENHQKKIHFISFSLDSNDLVLRVGPLFESVDIDDDHIIYLLAIAMVCEVPVYANTETVAPELARLHRRMLTEGFEISSEKTGEKQKYRLKNQPKFDMEGNEKLKTLRATEAFPPAELILLQSSLESDFNKLIRAQQLLAELDYAIKELAKQLSSRNRNESNLQNCLTEHPILFGLEYRLMKPKHRLGSEYEMDYALIKWDGSVDLIEIEASTHKLFTKNGNPTAALIHAEQQILDWLAWVEKNYSYAIQSLPGVSQPQGFVIIGLSEKFNEMERSRLQFRNQLLSGKLNILTYNDLYDRAKNIYDILVTRTEDKGFKP